MVSVYGWREKKNEEESDGAFGVTVFVFPRHHSMWWIPAILRMLNSCLPTRSREWIPCFALICAAFAFLLNFLQVFYLFSLLILSPIPVWAIAECLCGVYLLAVVKPVRYLWEELLCRSVGAVARFWCLTEFKGCLLSTGYLKGIMLDFFLVPEILHQCLWK